LDIDSTLSTSESLIDVDIFRTSNILNEPHTDSVDETIEEEEIAVVTNFKDTSNNSQEFLTTFCMHLIC